MELFLLSVVAVLIWIILAFGALPERPDFSALPLWRPRNPEVVLVAGIVGVVGLVAGLQSADTFDNALWRFFYDLAPEMVGLAVTVIVIDELVERANERIYKRRIFQQMRSPVRDAAVEAVRIVNDNEWWRGAKTSGKSPGFFIEVAWYRADLKKADLYGATFNGGTLQEADIS